jgi:predicted PurR-regulated permease PerM
MRGLDMAPVRSSNLETLQRTALGAIVAAAITAALFYGKDILLPITLAVILSFILSPLVNRLRSYLPHGPAVALVVLLAVGITAAVGFALARQVIDLGNDLPKYESTLREKLKSFRTGTAQSGVIDRATATLRGLGHELEQSGQAASSSDQKPIPVEVRQPNGGPLEIYQRIMAVLIAPMTTTAIVLIMVIFILLQRDDIRDRVIRLAGTRDLKVTTAALNDAASRLSRLFLVQTALNAAFGIIIGAGLWVIGVPSAALWGGFAGVMRFIPYIGAPASAVFPILLAAAVDPGWSMVVQTICLFAIIEPLTGQFIEPWVQGHSTGLSPLAIVISAVLWTTLWGPIGLLISTPITMCLVVLGRHIKGLTFLDVILGDEPALTPPETFYQRLLAGASGQATDEADDYLKAGHLISYFDRVALPGLRLAAVDAKSGTIDSAQMMELREEVTLILEDLVDQPAPHQEATPDNAQKVVGPEPAIRPDGLLPDYQSEQARVLCIGARTPLDTASAEILAQVLSRQGIKARSASVDRLAKLSTLDLDQIKLLWICSLDAQNEQAHMRYLVRHIKRIAPDILICGGFWQREGGHDVISEAHDVVDDITSAVLATIRQVSASPNNIKQVGAANVITSVPA